MRARAAILKISSRKIDRTAVIRFITIVVNVTRNILFEIIKYEKTVRKTPDFSVEYKVRGA